MDTMCLGTMLLPRRRPSWSASWGASCGYNGRHHTVETRITSRPTKVHCTRSTTSRVDWRDSIGRRFRGCSSSCYRKIKVDPAISRNTDTCIQMRNVPVRSGPFYWSGLLDVGLSSVSNCRRERYQILHDTLPLSVVAQRTKRMVNWTWLSFQGARV